MTDELTPEMRGWLNNRQFADEYVYDVVRAFMAEFGIGSLAAGRLIGRWIRETV